MSANKSNAVRKDDDAPDAVAKGASTSAKNCTTLTGKAVDAVRVTMQSAALEKPIVHAAAMATLAHAEKYGDVTLADRLVKSIRDLGGEHANTTALYLVAWFRMRSPIRWDAKEAVRQAKEGEPGFKAYDTAAAEKEAFFQTPAAIEADKAAALTRKRVAGDPLTYDNIVARARGIRKTYEAALTKKDDDGNVKGINKGDKAKIVAFLAALDGIIPETEKEDK